MKNLFRLMRRSLAPVSLLLLLCPPRAIANDSEAETAAGGLQLREERRVAMLSERLTIVKTYIGEDGSHIPSRENRFRVTVEYEFRNESKEDVTTEVAFPLPEFQYRYEDLNGIRKIRGFSVRVDGAEKAYETEVRAKAGGRDVTVLLRKAGIDIETFGGYEGPDAKRPGKYRIDRLPQTTKDALKAAGALWDDLAPHWSVAITHHWKQTFPAGKIVRVKHEYDAIPGFSYGSQADQYLSRLENGCFDPGLVRALESAQARASQAGQEVLVWSEWVKYILTTANTWQTPIRDFELIVERPAGQYVSFCWDGPVEKLSETRFRARAADFIPNRELLIYFLSVGK
jgi:hypothetical protein